MKTAKQMIDELLTIQEGELKGAQRTPTKADIEYLMVEYHGQFEKSELEKYGYSFETGI